jgi:hypothetical protein
MTLKPLYFCGLLMCVLPCQGSIKLSFAGSAATDKQQEKGGQFKSKPEIKVKSNF